MPQSCQPLLARSSNISLLQLAVPASTTEFLPPKTQSQWLCSWRIVARSPIAHGKAANEELVHRVGIRSVSAVKIEQKARHRIVADFRGRVMTLPHSCYDRGCSFRAFYEGNERATGIEPAWPAWKAGTLPLSYARLVRSEVLKFSRVNSDW